MDKLKISTRLTLLIVSMSLLLVASGGMGLFSLGQSNAALHSVYEERTVPMGQLGHIESLLLGNRLAIAMAMVTPTAEVIADSTAKIDANIVEISKTWDAYVANPLNVEEDKVAKAFAQDRKSFVNEGLKPTLEALKANNVEEAKRLTVTKIRPLYEPVKKGVDALLELQMTEAKREFTLATARYDSLRLLTVGGILLGVASAALFGFVLVRSISRQLGAEPALAAAVAKRVAAGDLSAAISLRPGDSTSLMAQLQGMQTSLSRVVSDVRQNSEAVASASAQIAQGNSDLSSRTEEQASALQQTAASMEQLSAAVKQNADNAQQANERALGASTVAARGGDVVGQVVATMKGINESSNKIADIISVIDSIAFQTNILALNAAVEAARAGEQGRGFAVVASEVRSLAGRSAEAAKEIKTLIDASVERVERGTQLADQAGTTMAEVVTAIKHVTDIMSELSAASAEQSAGVAQVGEAVSQMDRTTQQNAALVEESAAAAESLKVQAEQLVGAVALFKLVAGDMLTVATDTGPVPMSMHTPRAEERRGPQRASNVTRPAFGAKAVVKLDEKAVVPQATTAHPEQPTSPANQSPSTPNRAGTGTDDWTTF